MERAGLALFVVLCAVGVLGTFLHDVPYLGLASFVAAPRATWIMILNLAAAGFFGWYARRHRRRSTVVLAALSVTIAVGAGVVVGRMAVAAERAGADINILRTVGVAPAVVPVPSLEVAYTTYKDQPLFLSVYPPARSPAGRPAPVMVYVHSGGWVGGTRGDRGNDMRWFADRGLMVVSVDYTLSSDTQHLWQVTESQIACALVWVGTNVRALGGDPDRLSVTGDSTGGNLALNVAYKRADKTLRSSCGGDIPAVRAVSVGYPVTDPTRLYHNDDPFFARLSRTIASAYTGGTPEQFPDRYREITPATHLSKGAPRTLVIAGDADGLTDLGDAERFADQARGAGAAVSLVRMPFADHSFDRMPGSIGQQLYRQLTLAWMTAVDPRTG